MSNTIRLDMDTQLFKDLLMLCVDNPENSTLARLMNSTIRLDMDMQLFKDLLVLCIENPDNQTLERLNAVLDDKLNRMRKREFYTQSKSAGTPAERERARQEYLERAGIPSDYRWGPEGAD